MNPLISIIMPAYNAAPYISQAIDSILAQTYSNWELLIADDGSTDNTRQIIAGYTDLRIKTFHNEKNLGYLKTCNKLFALCAGDYITFQDADDWSDPERLQLQLYEFLKDADLGICGTNVVVVDEEGKFIRLHQKTEADAGIREKIGLHNQFGGATIMIPAEVYRQIGGYRGFFDRIGSEDYDWCARIIEKYKGKNIQRNCYYYRQTNTSVTKTVNHRNYLSSHFVREFIRQRQISRADFLESDDQAGLQKLVSELEQPFKKDSTLIYRKYAESYMYCNLRTEAIKISFKAFCKKPLYLKNLHTLIYCVRKTIQKKM